MSLDRKSSLIISSAVVAVIIAGTGVYLNNPGLQAAGPLAAQETGAPAAGDSVEASDEIETRVSQGFKADKDVASPFESWGKVNEAALKRAPEFVGITGYINTEELMLADLRGKVVLVDFWTYSCYNCVNTIPHVVGWHEKYADRGLVIVGIHTPEFAFEKDPDNVRAAVEKFGIRFPVLQDNDYQTWKAYENRYWPRFYLVDTEGYIRYSHIGEGNYSGTEAMIIELLKEV